jgi:glucokinase|tara:strand:- start:3157 stop:4074 length:918 start_codon:yes stop_codon:yes gene_type:complete
MKTNYFGIDIGGTKIKSILLNEQDEIIEQNETLTEDSSAQPKRWKQKVIDLINIKSQELDPQNKGLVQFGISAPGLTDASNTQILHMPGRLAGLEHYNWSTELNKNIYVVNDGHSACLAEYHSYYKQKNIQNLLLLTLGTGVGGGAILDGKLFQGAIQRAGHFGHITIDHTGSSIATNMVGSLEYAMGNFSVSERTHGKYTSVKELVSSYRQGEELASYWWLSSIQKLATGLVSLSNAFSPEIIVLGGGITTGSGDDLMNPLHKFMSLYEWRPGSHQVKVIQAQHKEFAGAIGAAFFAKSQINQL